MKSVLDRPISRSVVAGLLATFLAAQAAPLIMPSAVGLGILAVGMGSALALAGLASPVVAVLLLLVACFVRIALTDIGLPVDPWTVAFAGVLAAAGVAVARRTVRMPQFSVVEVLMALFLAWNIISAILPHEFPAGAPGELFSTERYILTGTFMPFALYLVGRFVFDREYAVRALLWTVMAFTAYSTAVNILEFHAPALVYPRFIVEVVLEGWETRANGIFNQPVVNGMLLSIGFVTALHLANDAAAPRWQRALAVGIAVPSIYGIYLTHTRAVWLGFGLLLVLMAVLARGYRTGFVMAIVGVLMGVALNWSTFTSDDRASGGVGSTNEVYDRLNGIATSIWAVQEKPVLGWGIGRFSSINTYYHQRWSHDIVWERGHKYVSHQNEFGIAAELGLVGVSLWLVVLVLVLRRMIRTIRELPADGLCGRGLALVAVSAFTAWVIAGTTVDLRVFDFPNVLVMLLVGSAIGVGERHSARRRSGGAGELAATAGDGESSTASGPLGITVNMHAPDYRKPGPALVAEHDIHGRTK